MRWMLPLLLVAGVAGAEPKFPGNLPAGSSACKHDAECVIVPSPCGDVAVHRDFLAQARQLDDRSCLGVASWASAQCHAGRCQVESAGLGARPAPAHTLGHTFPDPARYAAAWESPKRDARQKPDEVVRHLAVKPGMTVVDVGAGTGYFLPRLARAAGGKGKVLALDIEAAMVKHLERRIAREKLQSVSARLVKPEDPGLEAASVDRVLVVNTWHHIARRAAYAARLRDALRPGGVVLIVDFTLEAKQGPPQRERLTAEQVAAELEQAGLEPRILAETLPDHYLVAARRR